MKIYFEDGILLDPNQLDIDGFLVTINAAEGPRENRQKLEYAKKYHPNIPIYTNSLIALSNEYAWNTDLNVPEIYIRTGEYSSFARIDTLTEKELKFAHNICKLYLAGAFDTSTPMVDSIYGESKTKIVIDRVIKELETN